MLGRWLRRIGLFLLVLLVLGAAGFVLWATNIPAPAPQAMEALKSSPEVIVNRADWIEFLPQVAPKHMGLILYPGGKVPAEAYAPLGRALAEDGYYVAILFAPLNLALFNSEAAGAVFTAHSDVRTWVVGGHSLGGVAASLFAAGHADRVRGLLLMASTPANDALLTKTNLAITSVYGTNDGLFTVDSLEKSKALLPPQTVYTKIEGGNHGQFGWYGPQAGDNAATIAPEEQQVQIVNAAKALFESLK